MQLVTQFPDLASLNLTWADVMELPVSRRDGFLHYLDNVNSQIIGARNRHR